MWADISDTISPLSLGEIGVLLRAVSPGYVSSYRGWPSVEPGDIERGIIGVIQGGWS